jgi:hypothetical protein
VRVRSGEREILARFEARLEEIADEIADATVAEVAAFDPMRDATLRAEVRALSRRQLDAFLAATRRGGVPSTEIVAVVRERAALRARQLVPLAALLHSYLIAQRVISAAIGREAGSGPDPAGDQKGTGRPGAARHRPGLCRRRSQRDGRGAGDVVAPQLRPLPAAPRRRVDRP